MLDIIIYSYEEKNPNIKYDRGFREWEEESIEIALRLYEIEQFDILEKFFFTVYEYIALIGKDYIKDSLYVVTVFAFIFSEMRKNEKRYNKYLDYHINQLHKFNSRYASGTYSHKNYTRELAEKSILARYQIIYSLVE